MKRRQFNANFKFQIALEAVKGLQTINEVASHYEVHPTQVKQWKKELQEHGSEIFSEKRAKDQAAQSEVEASLYEQIGRLRVELEWLKKKVA